MYSVMVATRLFIAAFAPLVKGFAFLVAGDFISYPLWCYNLRPGVIGSGVMAGVVALLSGKR